jgi:hypothetical protein
MTTMPALFHTPLWPAGHLPLKGGDQPAVLTRLISNIAEEVATSKLLISPLEGEMAGRPEGGAGKPGRQNSELLRSLA